jgi:hypothetical protein
MAIDGNVELNTTMIIVISEPKNEALTIRPVKAN